MQVLEGHLDAQGLRFAIVVSRFNEALTSRLESGALDCLQRHGADDDQITIVRVPGAWEIPLVAAKLAADGGFDAVISVGALVRGGTAHFDLLEGVVFAWNSADLLAESRPALDETARSLQAWPEVRIEVSGHTSTSAEVSSTKTAPSVGI